MKRKLVIAAAALAVLFVLAGCGEKEQVPVNKELPRMNPYTGNKITFDHEVGGSKVTTSYDLGSYKLENWRITDTKSVTFSVGVKKAQAGTELLVEHVHSVVAIKATSPQLNGLTQDSMDNSYHGTSQDGFLINPKYPYSNVFAIDGFSKDLIDGWMFAVGDYGEGRITQKRLTEGNLRDSGAYGSEVVFIYNLLVKAPGDDKYHVETLEDRFIVPTVSENSADGVEE
ncbi:hypothetical protein ACM1RC_30345 [Paenibacillus azoreducens]|uniref:hypothetical protein n=1 Tax=Paenibacillus azoreducens TaxID=116718 RepID=UPI0039F52AEF